MSDDQFRRQVLFTPGHTIRRSRGDGSDYGIASMRVALLLHGEHGTTQFFTGGDAAIWPVLEEEYREIDEAALALAEGQRS